MKTRGKTIIRFSLATTLMILLLSLISRNTILEPFKVLEKNSVLANLDHIAHTFWDEVDRVSALAGDWGPWDDTYEFANNLEETYIQDFLGNNKLKNLDVDFMIFTNTFGEIIYSAIYESNYVDKKSEQQITDALLKYPDLLKPDGAKTSLKGLAVAEETILLVASSPILHSDNTGDVRGRIIVGIVVDEHRLAEYENFTQTRIDLTAVEHDAAREDDVVYDFSREVISVSRLLPGLSSNADIILKISLQRSMYTQGINSYRFFILLLVVISCFYLLGSLVLMEKGYLNPLRRITKYINKEDSSPLHEDTHFMARKDEFGLLAREIKKRIQKLEQYRRKHGEESYSQGIKEIIAEVSHNFNNQLTPIIGSLNIIEMQLQEEISRLSASSEEQSGESLPSESSAFYTGIIEELHSVVDKTISQLIDLSTVIGEQGALVSVNDWIVEKMDIQAIITEKFFILQSGSEENIELVFNEINKPCLFEGNRVLVETLFYHILHNRVSQINIAKITSATIHVDFQEEKVNGNPYLHIRIAVSGKGYTVQEIQNLFTQRYIVENGKSIINALHWCSNILNQMDGFIRVESDGPGKGSCIHVYL
jgi:sensor domain CHASE-containing protein